MNRDNLKNSLINWELVAVNPNDKKWKFIDLFCFWGVNIQSVIGFSLIGSLYLVYELNFFVVLLGCLIGSFFIYVFANLIGKPSQKYGLPFPVILRTSLGVKGAKYFALTRGLVAILMFGIQTYFLSKLLSYLIRISIFTYDNTFLDKDIFLSFFLGLNILNWISIIFITFLQIFLFSKSHKYNKSIIKFSAVMVYSGMFLFFLVFLLYDVKFVSQAFVNILSLESVFSKSNILPLITVAGTIFAYFSIVIVNFGDFSRYVKDEKELKKGNLSLFLNLIIFSFFAVFIIIGADIFLNKNLENMERILTNPKDIIGKIGNIQITILVLFFIIVSSVSTNLIANYIPAQNSLLNFLPTRLNLKTTGLIIAFFGFLVAIFWVPLFSQIEFLKYINTLICFFGPIFGIVVIDFYLIKKSYLNNKDIFSSHHDGEYFFSNGWHIKAIYSLILGFVFSLSTIWNESLLIFNSYSWIIGAFVSSLTYYLLVNK